MKVRITDLLDHYYDTTVRLDPPESFLENPTASSGVPSTSGKQLNRVQKPLLIAASLLLIFSGALALGLGFHRNVVPGHSLEATPSASILPSPEVPSPIPSPPVAPAPEPTMSPTPEPIEADVSVWEPTSALAAQQLPVDTFSFCQQGSELDFSVALSSVPEAYFHDCTLEAVAVQQDASGMISAQPLESITLEDDTSALLGSGYESHGQMHLTGHTTLQEGTSMLEFQIRLTSQDASLPSLLTDSIFILCSQTDCYVHGSSGEIWAISNLDGTLELRRLEITSDFKRFTFTIATPEEYLEPGAEELFTNYIASWLQLLDEAQQEYLVLNTKDGDVIQAGSSGVEYTVLEKQSSQGKTTVEAVIYLDTSIDPLKIENIEYWPYNDPHLADSSEDALPDSGGDVDGDGLLTAVLNLPIKHNDEEGILTRLTIEISTGKISWHKEIPELAKMLESFSAEKNLDAALDDTEYNLASVGWDNAILEKYLVGSELVFTDGTRVALDGGDIISFVEGEFVESLYLSWLAEDGSLRLDGLEPEYLIVNGTTYSFE